MAKYIKVLVRLTPEQIDAARKRGQLNEIVRRALDKFLKLKAA